MSPLWMLSTMTLFSSCRSATCSAATSSCSPTSRRLSERYAPMRATVAQATPVTKTE